MTSADLRNRVKEYVDAADDRLLKMLKALAETYLNEEQESSLSEKDYQVIDSRRDAHSKGITKSFTWEEVKQNASKTNS